MDIKKIIREEIDSSLHNWDWTEEIKPMEPGMLWLKDNFNNLKKIYKPEHFQRAYYVDQKGKPLFYYTYGNNDTVVWINTDKIWLKLKDKFNMDDPEVQKLIQDWLSQKPYGLSGYRARIFESPSPVWDWTIVDNVH